MQLSTFDFFLGALDECSVSTYGHSSSGWEPLAYIKFAWGFAWDGADLTTHSFSVKTVVFVLGTKSARHLQVDEFVRPDWFLPISSFPK